MTKTLEEILYSTFETCLSENNDSKADISQFCENVAARQIENLRREGFAVPARYQELLKKELEDDALEMYRKKTYGSPSLAEFQKRPAKKQNPR